MVIKIDSISLVCRLCFSAWAPVFELLPEQEEKAVDLQHDSDDGPANQHHKHTSEEETGGLHLVLLEEEAEGPLQPNDEGESSNKQDLQQKMRVVNIREWKVGLQTRVCKWQMCSWSHLKWSEAKREWRREIRLKLKQQSL